jgi:hypothetical protein
MLNIKSLDLRSDAAENSIMQTITIAVSAILIAAGLVTAPGLINNARDNNATTDLANIAYGEEFNLANTGTYAADLATLQSNANAAIADGGSGPKITVSGGTWDSVKVAADAKSYTLYAVSQSGNVFSRTSDSGATTKVGTFSFTGTGSAKALGTFTGTGTLVAGDFTKN